MAVETISKLTIAGFKSIRDLRNFELRPMNVLIGANGTGKSNFVDFFLMMNYMFASASGGLGIFVAREGRASSIMHYGAQRTGALDASLQFDGEGQWSRYSFRLVWGAPDDLFFASEILEYQREKQDITPRSIQLGSGHFESAVLGTGRAADQVRAVFLTNRLRRIRTYHFHDTSAEARVRTAQDLDREKYLMTNAGNLAAFLHYLKTTRPDHYQRILSNVQLVAPFIRELVLDPEPMNDRFVMLRWMDRSGEVFGPHQLSDGTIRAIALITALMQPDETMPNVLVFDEPELGLHPAAIGLVSTLLKAASRERQIIVATQSPGLIREYAAEDVIVVGRQEDERGRGESTFTRLDAAGLETWLEDYDLGELYEKNVTGGYPG